MTVSTTLRDVIGLDGALPALSASTLIMIDFQNTYRTGVMALPDADRALDAAARLLDRARAAGALWCTWSTTAAKAARTTSGPRSGGSTRASRPGTASRSW